jgi:hypothetical protein
LIWLAACAAEQSQEEETLAEASQSVIFASTEAIGPHHFQSVLNRKEYRDGELETHSLESTEIFWQSWDSFEYSQTVDSETVLHVIVTDGAYWKKLYDGEWTSRDDAESYRVQLRQKWNVWERLTKPFVLGIKFQAAGLETLQDRETQHYTLHFDPLGQSIQSSLKPISIEGDVWVDTQTAVRILGNVRSIQEDSRYRKELELKVSRIEIGQPISIQAPIANKQTDGLEQFLTPPER